jgi:hypothetical protein
MMLNSFVQLQNQHMQRKTLFRFGLIALLLLSSFLLLHGTRQANKETTCRESMNCSQLNQKVSGSGGMIWENLSRSFFSISSSY